MSVYLTPVYLTSFCVVISVDSIIRRPLPPHSYTRTVTRALVESLLFQYVLGPSCDLGGHSH